MIEAVGGNFWSVLALSEDEGALDDGLGVKREALGAPLAIDAVFADCFGDVRFERSRIPGRTSASMNWRTVPRISFWWSLSEKSITGLWTKSLRKNVQPMLAQPAEKQKAAGIG